MSNNIDSFDFMYIFTSACNTTIEGHSESITIFTINIDNNVYIILIFLLLFCLMY